MAEPDRLVPRMHGFGTTVFAEMSALAVATGSVNLGQGFPDTDGPPLILDAAVEAIRSGHNQYPPGVGIPALRHAIADHQRRLYDLDLDPDGEVLVTAGATEAIAAAVTALAGNGDEVVLFEPYFDSYAATVALSGATRRSVTLERNGQHWGFDHDALRAAITPRTKVILLNTPHNPTGTVFGVEDLAVVAELAIEHDLVVVSDEVYEHLIFDERVHVPIATLPGMRERTITIGSAGKTFSVTGWKIGWACGPADLLRAVRTVKQFLTFVNGAPFQPAVAVALDQAEKLAPTAALQDQRDLFCAGLTDLGFDVVVPQATYFATVAVDGDAVDYCRELPTRAGVVAIPSSVFYDSHAGDHFVRFAFCKRPEVLRDALTRLAAVAR
ncbi:pyridoxal phosphate-dependent aminotransferase [uncultured Jatrophihabitans sp.]|uniref:pyridoxal phosphate-dependent aminotransferase n=1 Tax=uncultured Jatrophihabitans sp. TaxID=1610747 RepID=UPI0035CC544C